MEFAVANMSSFEVNADVQPLPTNPAPVHTATLMANSKPTTTTATMYSMLSPLPSPQSEGQASAEHTKVGEATVTETHLDSPLTCNMCKPTHTSFDATQLHQQVFSPSSSLSPPTSPPGSAANGSSHPSFHEQATKACMPLLCTAASLGHTLALEWGYPVAHLVPVELVVDIAAKLRAMNIGVSSVVFTGTAIAKAVAPLQAGVCNGVIVGQPCAGAEEPERVATATGEEAGSQAGSQAESLAQAVSLAGAPTEDVSTPHECTQEQAAPPPSTTPPPHAESTSSTPPLQADDAGSHTLERQSSHSSATSSASSSPCSTHSSDQVRPDVQAFAAGSEFSNLLDMVFVLDRRTTRQQLFEMREVTLDALLSLLPENVRRKSRHMVAAAYIQAMFVTAVPTHINDEAWAAFTLHAYDDSPVLRLKYVVHSPTLQPVQLISPLALVLSWTGSGKVEALEQHYSAEVEGKGLSSTSARCVLLAPITAPLHIECNTTTATPTTSSTTSVQGTFYAYAVKIHELFSATTASAGVCMRNMCCGQPPQPHPSQE